MQQHYIKEWRKKRKLTQKELAARMEREPGVELMSYVTVSNIERGEQSPTLEQLYALADALDVTIAMLVTHHPDKDGEVVDLLGRLRPDNRETVLKMLKAAIGE